MSPSANLIFLYDRCIDMRKSFEGLNLLIESDFTLRNEAALLTTIGPGWSMKIADVTDFVTPPKRNQEHR